MRTTHFFHASSLHWRPIMCQHLSMFFVVKHVEPTNYIYMHYKILQVLPRQKNIPKDAKRDARWHQFPGKVSGDGNARLVLFAFIALFLTGLVYLNVESSVSRRILSSVYCGISRVCVVFVLLCLDVVWQFERLKDSHMLHGAGIFTNIYPINHPNVGKYTIHGAYGIDDWYLWSHMSLNMCRF